MARPEVGAKLRAELRALISGGSDPPRGAVFSILAVSTTRGGGRTGRQFVTAAWRSTWAAPLKPPLPRLQVLHQRLVEADARCPSARSRCSPSAHSSLVAARGTRPAPAGSRRACPWRRASACSSLLHVLELDQPSNGKCTSASSRMWNRMISLPRCRRWCRLCSTGSGSVSRSLKSMTRLLRADHGRELVQAVRPRRSARPASGWRARRGCCRAASACSAAAGTSRILRVERDQADRVLLVDHQVAEGGGQADGVLELGQLLAVRCTAIDARQVHDQVAGDVRLGLELLDVVLVGLGVDVPVEVLEVVAGDVLAVLGELDREALERAGVQAGQEALDDELGPQVEPGRPGG